MLRQIIIIDRDKCDGCGLCVQACHEGAIGLQDGKAVLLRDDYCDGLGNCLPVCPTGAISFEEREALPYDDVAVKQNAAQAKPLACGCPGSSAKAIERKSVETCNCHSASDGQTPQVETQLAQWPVQIKLVPVNASYLQNADLLISADCAAYAYGNYHNDFIKGRIALIGCPKLDEGDYSEKLTAILRENDVKSVTVVRMEVPCCGGIERAAVSAIQNAGKGTPGQVVTISTDGRVVHTETL